MQARFLYIHARYFTSYTFTGFKYKAIKESSKFSKLSRMWWSLFFKVFIYLFFYFFLFYSHEKITTIALSSFFILLLFCCCFSLAFLIKFLNLLKPNSFFITVLTFNQNGLVLYLWLALSYRVCMFDNISVLKQL